MYEISSSIFIFSKENRTVLAYCNRYYFVLFAGMCIFYPRFIPRSVNQQDINLLVDKRSNCAVCEKKHLSRRM